jgi:Uma2 family endonuclease
MSAEEYDRAAQEYLAGLPPEHFMEATPQSVQREITLASFALVRRGRPKFHYFSELLVQYFHQGQFHQVVPDNMVVLGQVVERPRSNWAAELEPALIFWTLEYVSRTNKRKDYQDSYRKYEQELQVSYYLTFDPQEQDLRLNRHTGASYVPVEAKEGRYPLPELELEVGLLGGWVRYWHRGELLPLPAESQDRLDSALKRNRELEREFSHREAQLRDRDQTLSELDQQLSELDQKLAERAQQLTERDRELSERDHRLSERDRQLTERSRELSERDHQLSERAQQLAAVLSSLRPLVETRARLAGRQDILDRLPGATDAQQLTGWLAELG